MERTFISKTVNKCPTTNHHDQRSTLLAKLKAMPQITVPLGSKIVPISKKIIQIKVQNTKFWVVGEKLSNDKWNAYLLDSKTNKRELIKEEVTTRTFSIFSNVILKTPFPFSGKRATNVRNIKKFINQITKNTCLPKMLPQLPL